MSIHGTITLEDTVIKFSCRSDIDKTEVVVTDTYYKKTSITVEDTNNFMKALSIAIHPDGMPEYKKDYPDAESLACKRFIP